MFGSVYAAGRIRTTLWLVGIITGLAIASVNPTLAQPSVSSSAGIPVSAEHEGVLILADGAVTLAQSTAPPPAYARAYQRHGSFEAKARQFATATTRFRVSYQATTPPATDLLVDLRGSRDGRSWTQWQTGLSGGAVVTFAEPVRYVQYRLILLGSADAAPTLHNIELQPLSGASSGRATADAAPADAAPSATDGLAPTFRVRGTRMGMVGGRTANGYIIQPRAWFVSLPSRRSLASRGGYEYQVRISYNGRSAVAPVWDIGPWNTRDDYWSPSRERFSYLPQGWPQDHAAFYQGHNGGRAEKGYVRFPTAIDVGDGVWWDALGIHGDQAELEVTFLWMGADPLSAPPTTDPHAPEFQVDELSADFQRSNARWYPGPNGCGEGNHSFWAPTTANPARSTHQGRWQPYLPTERLYDVLVHIPICPNDLPPSGQARYLVHHRDGVTEVTVDQNEFTHWVWLGKFPFAAGDAGFVELTNVTGESGRAVWFDQARWIPAD